VILEDATWKGVTGAATAAIAVIAFATWQDSSRILAADGPSTDKQNPSGYSEELRGGGGVPLQVEVGKHVESMTFNVIYPLPNSTVPKEAIILRGVGAVLGAEIRASVFTDEAYLQNGHFEIASDGSWLYGPCQLKGIGPYNDHTIIVSMEKNGVTLARNVISGVRRL
jgi:hypothetical protein